MATNATEGRRAVDLVIRFTTSTPDLVVTVLDPSHESVLGLKRSIRSQIPEDVSRRRLRLIWGGKVLSDKDALSQSITIPLPPPAGASSSSSGASKDGVVNGKGKNAAHASPPPPPPQAATRIYIHCSIGDPLTPAELEEEARSAQAANQALISRSSGDGDDDSTAGPGPSSAGPRRKLPSRPAAAAARTTTTSPRGFDRLLDAGFSADEVATLRTQFLAVQAHTHTPDTMPAGEELRALEDGWLDGEAGGSVSVSGVDGMGTGRGGFVGADEDGDVEDMLRGILVGFFWPVAAVCWLMKEEGVWSPRYQTAVWVGALINVTFGALRLSS